jgi:hypothetical protein
MRQGLRKTGVSKEIGAAGRAGRFVASPKTFFEAAAKDEVVGVTFLRAILRPGAKALVAPRPTGRIRRPLRDAERSHSPNFVTGF